LTAQDLVTLPSRFQRNVVHTSSFSPNQVTVQGEKRQTFNFDCVFGPDSTQKEVYDKIGVELVDKFLEGEFLFGMIFYVMCPFVSHLTPRTLRNDLH